MLAQSEATLSRLEESSRVQRWARCELPWLNPPGGGAGGLEDMLSDLDMWACGDAFFA